MQLWYQIALAGRRDLPLAPDPELGLEMTLLRMLAFRPAEEPVSPPDRRAAPALPQAAGPAPAPAGGAAEGGLDWEALVASLPQGPVRQLASHCVLEGREGERIRLALDPACAALRTPRVEERLRRALEEAVGGTVRLELRLAEREARDATPAARRRAEARARQRAAEEALRGERPFRELQEVLEATVVPGSVAPPEDA